MARTPARGRESASTDAPSEDRSSDERSGDSESSTATQDVREERGERSEGRGSGRGGDRRGPRNESRRRNGGPPPSLDIGELEQRSLDELVAVATEYEIQNAVGLPKQELIFRILQDQAERQGTIFSGGVLSVVDDGFGLLRGERLIPGRNDVYVSQSQIRRFGLRNGDYVTGQVRQPKDSEKYYGLLRVEAVNGVEPEEARRRPQFENLTPIFPNKMLKLETDSSELSQRIVDLFAPIGRGQRGLIVSPPKAGKTMLLKSIAHGIIQNSPDIHLMVLLIGERPEEVTDMRRSVRGEVIASTFDEPVEDHTRVAEVAIERARRLVEGGTDVVILMDSITRLARAYNLAIPTSGRTLSGGMDPIALYPPKRFFGAARNTEEGGSLTIIATCLVETGSRMDDVIFEEFKGTGNMELRLDRRLAEKRVYPAIDIFASSTRREDLLFDEDTLRQVWLLRRMASMVGEGGTDATERVLERLTKTEANADFLGSLKSEVI